MSSEIFRIGEILLNPGTQEVTLDGRAVPLPPLSFSLLLTLVRHAPNVVTTRQLEDEVWEGVVVDRGTINKRVLLVRKALREAGCREEYVAVVRGTGYRLSVSVQRLETGDDFPRPAAGSVPDRRFRAEFQTWGPVVLVVFAALAVINFRDYRDPATVPEAPGIISSHEAALVGHGGAPALAVLPFLDQGETRQDAYLGEGIAQEIINRLSGIDELRVVSSSSSFTFRNPDEPVSEVAAQLGVESILKGTVLRWDDRIRVVAELVDAHSEGTLWTGSYERSLDDVIQMQDDIARHAARGLRVHLAQHERAGSPPATTGNVDVFAHYLKGRALLNDRIHAGADGLREALAFFERAAEADPHFVLAHTGIASVQFLLPAYDNTLDPVPYFGRAEANARFALGLDPSSTEAIGVLAGVLAERGESTRAAALFEQGRELGYTDSNFIHWRALLMTSMGYFSDLVPTLDEAYRLDPLNQYLGCSLGTALRLSGDPESSAEVLSDIDAFPTRNYALALARLYLGEFAEARQLLRGLEMRSGVLDPEYADRLVDAFESPAAHRRSEEALLAAAGNGQLAPLVAFEALLILGSPRAFSVEVDLKGSEFEHRLPEAVWNNWGVELRRDPRFKSWVRNLDYDQYWRRNGWPDRCKPTGLDDFECV